ncbi:MAG TPA: sensor histidine kinase [Planctomycetaceae bacterium]|jgi:two-component system sensor histidine kinase UhpB|nr:sensor histidine kinase [Planctomycetaceae bacterium]
MSPSIGTVLSAGLVCACCYFGSFLGAKLKFPFVDTAILFPPYAVLTAALLLAPPRRWWVYALASSLGNFVPHQQGWPISWVLLTEVVNLLRALLAAGGIRYFNGSARFDSLRGVAVFLLLAVLLAPAIGGFGGACVVTLHRPAEDFWLVWRAWYFSNALTGLTLLPVIVIAITGARAWVKKLRPKSLLEAALLSIGLLTICTLIFGGPYFVSSALPTRLFAPLPFLLWAATRFGPGGASASHLVITSGAIWGAIHDQGPFASQAPFESLLSLQLFLISISVPLLVLAAMLEERQQITRALETSNQQIQELAGRLITAQENERGRIARELHDNACQQLAALSIAFSSVRRSLPQSAEDAQREIGALQQRTIGLAEELRHLSHELHPAVLQHAGLTAALRGSFDEFGRLHRIAVEFRADGALEGLPAEVALCLFRIAQEAQKNIAVHAKAQHVHVALRRNADRLELTVRDDGQGFNILKARQLDGLGLVSMDERARLLGGRVQIDSAPARGTQIRAVVPLNGDVKSI